jgi:hypothetical protein
MVTPQEQTQVEDFADFNAIYSQRLEKMEKKNETKQEYLNKKKQLK